MDRNPEAEPAKAAFGKEQVRTLSGDFFSREKRRLITPHLSQKPQHG